MRGMVFKTKRYNVPKEGQAVPIRLDGTLYYMSLGRDTKGRLLALITEGHPNAGDHNVVLQTITVVKDRNEAGAWFAKSLLEKPWLPRQ